MVSRIEGTTPRVIQGVPTNGERTDTDLRSEKIRNTTPGEKISSKHT